MRRREFFGVVGGATAWPVTALAQQALPVIGFVNTGSATGSAARAAGFRHGLLVGGAIEGQNVAIEYHWPEGHNDRLPSVMAGLLCSNVDGLSTPVSCPASRAPI